MPKIVENVTRRIGELSGDPLQIGLNLGAALAAMRKGVKSEEWEFYMTQFASDATGKVDPAQLARLMGTDGTLGNLALDRKRGYLLGNAMCGDTTITETDYGVDSIDNGVAGEICDPLASPCIAAGGGEGQP